MLTQGRLEELLRYWRARYDRIILDGCPYEAVADASLMARHADLVLYVIRCGMIEKQYVPVIQGLAEEGRSRSELLSSMCVSKIPVFITTTSIPKLTDSAVDRPLFFSSSPIAFFPVFSSSTVS